MRGLSRMFKTLSFVAVLLSLVFISSSQGFAKEKKYPSRTVEVINQFGPGGGTDIFLRAIAMPFAKITRESLVPISIKGGGGVPAATEFFNRPADGYTLMAIGPEELINDAMGRIDAEQFIPLARIQYDQGMFYVKSNSQFKSIEDLIKFAKEKPNKLSIGVTGAAGFDEVLVGLWNIKTGAELKSIPFNSASEATAAVLGGHTDLVYEEFGPMRPLVESGKLRPLVVFSDKRLPVVQDVPTAIEAGADISLGRWRGIALKKGVADDQVEVLAGVFEKASEHKLYKMIEEQNMLQFRSKFQGPKEFSDFFEKEREIYRNVLTKLGYIK